MIATPKYLRRSQFLPLPATWAEIRLVAALTDYPAARHLARRLGLVPDNMNTQFSRQVVRELLDDLPISDWVAEALHEYDDDYPSWKGAIAICHKIDDGTPTEQGAAVRDFVAAIKDRELAEACSWTTGAIERGEFTPNDRRDLEAAQEAAQEAAGVAR